MKICLYSPYLPDHFGGGEKYLLDVATTFEKNNHHVFIAVTSAEPLSGARLGMIKKSYEEFLGHSLKSVRFINTPIRAKASFFKKLLWTQQFDVLFYITDGSLFFSLARNNIVHIQVPLKLDKSSFLEKIKLRNWQTKITNSNFTKRIVEKAWPTTINYVHQPMVDADEFCRGLDLAKKEPIILNVGRFFPQLHSKRQDILVEIFKRLIDKYKKETKDWRLILIGSVEDEQYALKVKKAAKGYPVTLLHKVSHQDLVDWYQRSSIYWHATGYRIDELEEPHKVEHFGISTVEAMAAGNVPVVIAKGGQAEVVGNKFLNWQWLTQRDCIKKTRQLIKNDQLRLELQRQAQQRALQFGPEIFEKKLMQMIA
jgi:glycosyltransferase involved in cell wall biosynthesis